MRNRAFYDQVADVFLDGTIHGRGLHYAVVAAGPGSTIEKSVRTFEHILRWEDDGGPASDAEDPSINRAEFDTSQH
jgi:hypothetical protein